MMRKRRAIIHIGTAKTGSTSIQRLLEGNRDALLENGYVYPRSPGEKNHFRLAIFAGTTARADKMARVTGEAGDAAYVARHFENDLTKEMQRLPDSVHTVIFSNEHCYRKIGTVDAARRLKGLLDRHFDDYVIIAYLRRQDELAVSLYSTRMRSGSDEMSVLPALDQGRKGAHRFDWEAMLDRWAEAFGRESVKPRRFAPEAFVGGNLLVDFQAACGMEPILDLTKAAVQNTSINASAQEFLRRLNATLGDDQGSGEKVSELVRRVVDEKFAGSGRRPSRVEAMEFYEAFRESNARLRAKYFPALPSVFSEDFSRYPQKADPIPSDADVLNVALCVIREQSARTPSRIADKAFRKATSSVTAGNVVEARRLFNRTLTKEPDHVGALRGLLSLGRSDKAIRLEALARLRRGLAAAPGSKSLLRLAAQNGLQVSSEGSDVRSAELKGGRLKAPEVLVESAPVESRDAMKQVRVSKRETPALGGRWTRRRVTVAGETF
jgi:hypothetical protein